MKRLVVPVHISSPLSLINSVCPYDTLGENRGKNQPHELSTSFPDLPEHGDIRMMVSQ